MAMQSLLTLKMGSSSSERRNLMAVGQDFRASPLSYSILWARFPNLARERLTKYLHTRSIFLTRK